LGLASWGCRCLLCFSRGSLKEEDYGVEVEINTMKWGIAELSFSRRKNGMVYGKKGFRWGVSNHKKKKSFRFGLLPEGNAIWF